MWKIVLFVLAFSYLVLFVLLRSVLLPLKAVLMNLLSVGAAYGMLVAIFQYGWIDGFLGFESLGYINTMTPPLLLAIVFGLSMDYEVFLLSRIRERYEATGDNRTAVAQGLARSAATITSAALIMVAVFSVFAGTGVPSIKEIGVGLAVAIALDATLVRLVLVPAAMELMGAGTGGFRGRSRACCPMRASRGSPESGRCRRGPSRGWGAAGMPGAIPWGVHGKEAFVLCPLPRRPAACDGRLERRSGHLHGGQRHKPRVAVDPAGNGQFTWSDASGATSVFHYCRVALGASDCAAATTAPRTPPTPRTSRAGMRSCPVARACCCWRRAAAPSMRRSGCTPRPTAARPSTPGVSRVPERQRRAHRRSGRLRARGHARPPRGEHRHDRRPADDRALLPGDRHDGESGLPGRVPHVDRQLVRRQPRPAGERARGGVVDARSRERPLAQVERHRQRQRPRPVDPSGAARPDEHRRQRQRGLGPSGIYVAYNTGALERAHLRGPPLHRVGLERADRAV